MLNPSWDAQNKNSNFKFFNFVIWLKLWSSISIFSQIWQYSKYEIRKFKHPFVLWASVMIFFNLYTKIFVFCELFSQKYIYIWQNVLFSKYFSQIGKNLLKKYQYTIQSHIFGQRIWNKLWCYTGISKCTLPCFFAWVEFSFLISFITIFGLESRLLQDLWYWFSFMLISLISCAIS
jgi:hypothetical protein